MSGGGRPDPWQSPVWRLFAAYPGNATVALTMSGRMIDVRRSHALIVVLNATLATAAAAKFFISRQEKRKNDRQNVREVFRPSLNARGREMHAGPAPFRWTVYRLGSLTSSSCNYISRRSLPAKAVAALGFLI